MKCIKQLFILAGCSLCTVIFSLSANAVVTEFDAIALDNGGNGTPFIRLEHPGQPDKFFVGFSNHFAFWAGSSYSFRIYQSATTNSLVLIDGNVGIGTSSPTEKLHIDGNTFISGNLELGSSRTIKTGIDKLTAEEALATFAKLEPVKFQYLHSPDEQSVGFIAEDVPDLVATKSRKSLSTMDMVAVLTKVIQEQQKAIEGLKKEISNLKNPAANL